MMEVKKEVIKSESGAVVKTRDKGDNQMQGKGEVNLLQDGRDKENRFNSGSSGHSNERDGPQKMSEEQQNASSVGVIVSSRPLVGHQCSLFQPNNKDGIQRRGRGSQWPTSQKERSHDAEHVTHGSPTP
jgi:hypothetical protein